MAQETTIRQLRGFAILAETGSFNKAAARMGISQPALSYQVSKLEDHLAVTLFERSPAGVILTAEGRAVLSLARGIIDGLNALDTISERLASGQLEEIRLGSSPTLGPYLLPKVMKKLRGRFPALRVYIEDAAPSILLDGLLSGRHDVIVAQLPLRSDRVAVERLFREPLRLAVPRSHPLATKPQIEDSDLAGESVLSLSSAFTLHAQLANLCDEVDAVLRMDYEGTSLDALSHMTAMEMGITFLPALYVKSEAVARQADIAIRPFRGDRFCRSIGLAWRKSSGQNAVLRVLSGIVRDVVAEEFLGTVILEKA